MSRHLKTFLVHQMQRIETSRYVHVRLFIASGASSLRHVIPIGIDPDVLADRFYAIVETTVGVVRVRELLSPAGATLLCPDSYETETVIATLCDALTNLRRNVPIPAMGAGRLVANVSATSPRDGGARA